MGAVMLAAFSATVACAVLCILLGYWQARRRRHLAADAVVVMVQSPRATGLPLGAGGAVRTVEKPFAFAEATVPQERFQVRRVSSLMFEVKESPAQGAASPPRTLPCSVEDLATPEADVARPTDEEAPCCDVCFEAPPEVIFLPCCHGDMCRSCAEQIVKRSNRHCHFCRRDVEKVILIEDLEALLGGKTTSARRLL